MRTPAFKFYTLNLSPKGFGSRDSRFLITKGRTKFYIYRLNKKMTEVDYSYNKSYNSFILDKKWVEVSKDVLNENAAH